MVFHGFREIYIFTVVPALAPILGPFFTSFRPQGPHLASLGLLLAPSGVPFGPSWGYFGTPWPPFGGALAPLGANSGHLGSPGHLLERFFNEFQGFCKILRMVFFAIIPKPSRISGPNGPNRPKGNHLQNFAKFCKNLQNFAKFCKWYFSL